jgi:hypothetical protein
MGQGAKSTLLLEQMSQSHVSIYDTLFCRYTALPVLHATMCDRLFTFHACQCLQPPASLKHRISTNVLLYWNLKIGIHTQIGPLQMLLSISGRRRVGPPALMNECNEHVQGCT